jgi:hypothetical protein
MGAAGFPDVILIVNSGLMLWDTYGPESDLQIHAEQAHFPASSARVAGFQPAPA